MPVILASDAYHVLRGMIVRGELRPNERLVESELAERLGVSRTPIREVLLRLSLDGLVSSRRRGWIVLDHSAEEITEIYEIRAALEGMAARLAAERATDEQVAAIAAIHKRNGMDSREHLVEVNDAFHRAIGAASGNTRLSDQVIRSRQHYFTYRIARLYTDEEVRASLAGHGRVVEALAARDPDAADHALREHVLEALAATLAKVT